MDNIKATHENKNFLVRKYFEIKLNTAVKFAELEKDDFILDFGCGSRQLKKKLFENSVVGYDITPEYTDVTDYTQLKPNKIFVLDVFEHMTPEEITKTIKNFKEMSDNFKLITAIPTENRISRILRRIIGKPERADGHITSLREIKNILDNELKLVKSKKLFTLSHIAVYEYL